MKQRKTPPTRGLVAVVWHDLLAILRFGGNSQIGKALLKILGDFVPHRLHVGLSNSSRRNECCHSIHDTLQDSHAKLKVDDCIGNINASDVNTHSELRLWDCGGVRLDDSVPRLRIFFVKRGGDKGCRQP